MLNQVRPANNLIDRGEHRSQRLRIGQPVVVPTTIRADSGRPLLRTSSWLSAKGTTSSACECRITVPGLTVRRRSPSLPGRAEQHERRRARVDIHGHGPAPAGSDDDIGMVPVELGLGDADGLIEIVVGQGRVEDRWPCSTR